MRKLLVLLVIIGLVTVVSAKGRFNRIMITGDGIDGQLVIQDDEALLNALAMTMMDLQQGPLAEAPANPGDYVELERQYFISGQYVTFDRVQYYPDGDYVFYIGMHNGGSEYDGRWFNALPENAATFEAYLQEQQVIRDQPDILQIVQAFFSRMIALLAN